MPVADDNAMRLRAQVEGEIERYLGNCRARVTPFVTRHFSAKAAAEAHARTARHDVIRHPLNLALALPSLVLRRAASLCERMEWTRLQALLERVPLPLKTSYERRVDAQLLNELFALPESTARVSPLTQALLRNETVASAMAVEPDALGFLRSDDWLRFELQKTIRDWASSRAQLIDTAGSSAVLATSYLVFRSSGHSVLEMGRKVASDRARQQAADHFFLGERIGSLFYSLAPVHPTNTQVVVATVIIVTFIGLLTVLVNLASDPLQRQFGMQQKQIMRAIDGLEERLLLTLRKRLRATGPITTQLPFFGGEHDSLPPLDIEEVTGQFTRGGTVKGLARVLAFGTVWWLRYAARVGAKFARWSVISVLIAGVLGSVIHHRLTHVDPYDEPLALIEREAYPTALARLDWLNRHPGYREQAYYWFLRGRAHCGLARGGNDASAADACAEAYQKALGRDISYREDEYLVDDVVALVREYNHTRAKKIVLQELGPESIGALKEAVLSAVDRFEAVTLLEQIGARPQVPYVEIAKRELDAAESCDDKKRVIERMVGEGWRDAVPLLKPLQQDQKKWKCLQSALKSALQRLRDPATPAR